MSFWLKSDSKNIPMILRTYGIFSYLFLMLLYFLILVSHVIFYLLIFQDYFSNPLGWNTHRMTLIYYLQKSRFHLSILFLKNKGIFLYGKDQKYR